MMKIVVSVVMLMTLAVAGTSTLGCTPRAQPGAAAQQELEREGSGPTPRWSYELTLDETLEHLHLDLCIEGLAPLRVIAGEEAMQFVESARVRGGPALVREGFGFAVEGLGEHGCLEFDIDIDAAAEAGGRDCMRRGDTLMVAPDRWFWYPAKVPAEIDARARLHLPEGVAATVPWPEASSEGWRPLEHTTFGWNAWIAFGRYTPLEFDVGGSRFEVAVLEGEREASDAGIIEWLETSAEASIELFGEFPRERVAVVVVPMRAWGDSPVLFGVARRGGGGSVMLMLNEQALDTELPGEWVSTHELLHLGMPYIAQPWMSEGFVSYYTEVLRARQGMLSPGADADTQTRQALEKLGRGFRRQSVSARTLGYASDNMRNGGGYSRVYWGGAAVAFDLDVSIRHASGNRHSLDDLMIRMRQLVPLHRRFPSDELIALLDEELDVWRKAGELDAEISVRAIVQRHLNAKSIPKSIEKLERLALERRGSDLTLLDQPVAQVEIRDSIFGARKTP